MFVYLFTFVDHTVIIQQLGENIIRSGIHILPLFRFNRLSILRFAHGPAHKRVIGAIDSFQDLFDPFFRNCRRLANGCQIP